VSTAATNQVAQTVLVVEDEVLVRMAVSQQLRECGYNVIEAVNADEALIVLRKPTISVHMVLSDVEMPGSMDGFGLATWVRKNRPELKVILAGSEARAVKAAMELCASGPVPGAYEPHNLLDYIRRLKATRAARKVLGHWRKFTARMRTSR
jgi:DNA-binding NtrC family response regulator